MIFPPRRSMARVEAFRRAHDPLHARIAAHLTLVFPMARPAAVERRVARVLSGATAGRIALRGTGRYPDGSVHLRWPRCTIRSARLCARRRLAPRPRIART